MNFFPIFFFVGLALLGWLLIVQPQRRRRRQHVEVLSAMESGDEVMTSGGIFGVVREVGDYHVVVEIAPGTNVRVAKSAVTARLEPEPEAAEPPETPLT